MDNDNKQVILVFPGQGSQYIQMGKSFLKSNKKYLKYFDVASLKAGKNIMDIINDNNGKGRYLDNTRYSQAAIYALSCAVNDFLFAEKGIKTGSVNLTLGHSLGDYSALYSCGAFSYEEGAQLVAFRGRIMAEEGDRPKGNMIMAAVIGSDIDIIEKVLKAYKDRVFIANINDYSQTVISGYADDVIKAGEKIKLYGAKRVLPLKVNIASHCPLMKNVSVSLGKYLDDNFISFDDFKIKFFSSTEVKEIKNDLIKQILVKQLLNPVRWKDSIEYIIFDFSKNFSNGKVKKLIFIEVGPGKVLSGLLKRIISHNNMDNIDVFNTDSIDDIERISI